MELKSKKAVFFSIDAIIALGMILLVLLFAFPLLKPSERETNLPKDILSTLSNLKIGEITNAQIQTWISQGLIEADRTVVEQIGLLSIKNITLAKSLASVIFQNLNTKENVGIWYGNNLIFSSNSTAYENASNIETERYIVSGIGGLNGTGLLSGFSARGYLSSSFRTEYFYFGGYVGDGNLTKNIVYNGTITSAEMEITISKNFTLYINGQNAGNYTQSPSDTTPSNYDLSAHLPKFSQGLNNLEFRGNSLYIAGGYVKITYDSNNTAYQPDSKQYLSGIEGIVNLYEGLSVPGQLQSIDISIHHKIPYSSFLSIGNVTVWNGSNSTGTTVTISNSQLSTLLNYNQLSNKTTPLRFGSENQSIFGNITAGNADVILITDVSGSMSGVVSGSGTSVVRNCSDPLIYNSNTQKLSLAKCLDEQFIYAILRGNNNKVGLVDFSSSASGFVNLSSDINLLNNTVQNYALAGATCVSCAINRAYMILQSDSQSSTRQKYIITMTDGVTNVRSTNSCYEIFGSSSNSTLSSISLQVGSTSAASKFNPPFSWQSVWPGSNTNLNNVDGINNTLAFAAGASSQIWRWNGISWTMHADLGNNNFYGIDLLNETLGFAVGDSGKFIRYNGTNWSEYQDTGNTGFKDVKFANSSTAFAVGDSGKIFKWNGTGTNWYELLDVGTQNLFSVDLLNSTYGLAVGGNGDIWKFNGTGWGLQTTISYILKDIDIFNTSLTYAVSSGGAILRQVGASSWSSGSYWGSYSLNTVTIINQTYGFAAGDAREGIIEWNGTTWTKIFPEYTYKGNSSTGLSCNDPGSCSLTQTAPMLNANYSSCRAHRELNATVHSIGFGNINTCTFANTTLRAIADCGNGTFFTSDNSTQLQQIYANISQNILQLSYSEQTALVAGNASGILYPDSYINLNYTKQSNPFGLILSMEKQFINSTTGNFTVYSNSTILDTRVTSYSGPKWTEKLWVNNILTYNINNFGLPYIKLGDPYSIIVPKSYILNQNNVALSTAVSSTNISVGSQYNKIIYTLAKNFTGFSPVVGNAQGCIWNLQFDDWTNLTTSIPASYTGTTQCYFPAQVGLATHDPNDAVQTAVYRLLNEIDLNQDGRLDIKFSEQALQIDTSQITGIPFTWYTEVQVRRWD